MDHEDATLDRRTLLRAGAGATAAAVGGAAATGSAAAQTQEIVVGPQSDQLTFSPSDVTVAPGTTVTFTWETDGHNVAPQSQPDGASWEGHPDVVGSGSTYEFTFETTGTYEYWCDPHSPGMSGSITVEEGAGEESGPVNTGPPEVSSAAMSLTTGLLGAFGGVLALAFFFTKYGGSDDEE